jgi:hypothetical protein
LVRQSVEFRTLNSSKTACSKLSESNLNFAQIADAFKLTCGKLVGPFLRKCELSGNFKETAAVQTSFSKDGNGGAGPVGKLPLSAGAAGYIDCFWNVALNQYSFGSGICQNHSGECIDI